MPTTGGRTADHKAKRRTAGQMKKAIKRNPNPAKRKSQKDMTRTTRSRRAY